MLYSTAPSAAEESAKSAFPHSLHKVQEKLDAAKGLLGCLTETAAKREPVYHDPIQVLAGMATQRIEEAISLLAKRNDRSAA